MAAAAAAEEAEEEEEKGEVEGFAVGAQREQREKRERFHARGGIVGERRGRRRGRGREEEEGVLGELQSAGQAIPLLVDQLKPITGDLTTALDDFEQGSSDEDMGLMEMTEVPRLCEVVVGGDTRFALVDLTPAPDTPPARCTNC